MTTTSHQKIVVKIGTNVITKENGELDKAILENLVEQIAQLKRQGKEMIIVTSGAMGAGSGLMPIPEEIPKVAKRQILASIGQIKLMNTYLELFKKRGEICSQILATKEDFRDRKHYFNMKVCFSSLLKIGVIPIINENDVIAVEELMFTDNDELAGMIAGLINASTVIILSSVDGLYDQHPKRSDAKILHEVNFQNTAVENFISPEKSLFGRGGMGTKCKVAKKLCLMGITTYIANGRKQNVLLDIANNKVIGTKFVPLKKISNIKKRIGSLSGYEKGTIFINEGAEKALTSGEKVSSLLLVGVTRIDGEFQKGDIAKICGKNKKVIGLGIVQYDSREAKNLIGKQNLKPLIQYDYLFIES